MFNFKILVLLAVMIHCILSMPTTDQEGPSNAPAGNDNDEGTYGISDSDGMTTAEHHYRGYGWGGYYYRPYYGGYYGHYYPRYYHWG